MKCWDCKVALTLNNRAGDKGEDIVYCQTCWDKYPPWEPTCPKCEDSLIADEENPFHIYCPDPVCEYNLMLKCICLH